MLGRRCVFSGTVFNVVLTPRNPSDAVSGTLQFTIDVDRQGNHSFVSVTMNYNCTV